MKKFLLILGVSALMFGGSAVRANDIAEKVLLYLPNRVIDAFDTFSVNIGVGPVLRAELMATRACVVGGGIGLSCMLYKDYNRQYGVGIDNGWYYQLICLGEAEQQRTAGSSLIMDYQNFFAGMPLPDERNYQLPDGPRDYWQIGGALGGLVVGEVYLHPLEIADFITGFFFFDLTGDDIVLDDLR